MISPQDIRDIVESHRDEAVRLFQEIVRTPSVTGHEEEVSRVFISWIRKCGLEAEVIEAVPHRPNLIAEWHGSKPGKRFIFNGHMDVFPAPEVRRPDYDPWGAEIKDGYLYGRGASDMKGGDCAAVMAVLLLRKLGFDPKGSVVLSFMCDEENGGWLGVKHLISKGLLKGDCGICMEPTYNRLLNRHWGILRMKVSYTARPQHAGRPHPTVDALEKAVAAVNRLYALDAELNRHVNMDGENACLSITMMKAGNTPNVQPGYAEFVIDRRLDYSETQEEALAQILGILDGLKKEDPEYDYKYEVWSDRPSFFIPEDDPFLELCSRSYEQIHGRKSELFHFPAGSDAASLRKAYGYPIPLYGPSEAFGDHGGGGADERCSIEDYLECIRGYMMIVVNALS